LAGGKFGEGGEDEFGFAHSRLSRARV
jgi:hypothetical protein